MATGCKLSKDDGSPYVDQKDYRYLIGGLLYLTASRPDIMQVVYLVSIYQANPKKTHDQAVIRIFRYMKRNLDYGLWYKKYVDFNLKEHADANQVRCVDDKRSISGGPFLLGDKSVSWLSKKHDSVS